MESHQLAAMEDHLVELVEAVKVLAVTLLSYLEIKRFIDSDERISIENSQLPSDQVLKVLKVLQTKDDGWSGIIGYLRKFKQNWLANKLEKTAAKHSASRICPQPVLSKLDQFANTLADYYRLHYANILTLSRLPCHVRDIHFISANGPNSYRSGANMRIDHIELLSQIGRNMILITGESLSGKTTLAKKLAYSWSEQCGSTDNHFALVLAVPLTAASKFTDFIEMAVNHFLYVVNLNTSLKFGDTDRMELFNLVRGLGHNLLIIVDGLDELESCNESPLKCLYADPNIEPRPPKFSFKLIITSKPYACRLVNKELFALQYTMAPLLKSDWLNSNLGVWTESAPGVNFYDNARKGLAMIINVDKFTYGTVLTETLDSGKDLTDSANLWSGQGYKVLQYSNLVGNKILEATVSFANDSRHEIHDSAVVVVMSNGSLQEIAGSDGKTINIRQLVDIICRSRFLRRKPKVLLFNTSIGEIDDGYVSGMEEATGEELAQKSLFWFKQNQLHHDGFEESEYSDSIIGFATSPGKYGDRYQNGSYYIQEICNTFRKPHATSHVVKLLDTVKDNLAKIEVGTNRGVEKQIPTYINNLRWDLFI